MIKTKMEIAFPLALGLIFMLSTCPTSAHQKLNLNLFGDAKDEQHHLPKEIESEEQSSLLQTYIVHVKKPHGDGSLESKDLDSWYHSLLPASTNEQSITFSYRNVVNGFAVKLTPEEAKVLQEKEEVVSARPEKILPLHTTHSPSFLGLQEGLGLWNGSNLGKGIIIGMLDTGITPNHTSFSDEGMSPPPTKWNGLCEFTGQRTCNNKLIGARNLVKSTNSTLPLDDVGHGTHTSSTAAGRPVQGASLFGDANGTAVGMAPDAHLAMYKVCHSFGCPESAILAGMDTAIEDGVDILSLSLGGPSEPFYDDTIALGAFTAVQKGIFVSCSAGNAGPDFFSTSNEAPWILTIGASSIDRSIAATVKLGNGQVVDGESLFQPTNFTTTLLPLVYAGANGNEASTYCEPGSLANVDVKGKIVVCEEDGLYDTVAKGQEVIDNGGAAMILINAEIEGSTILVDTSVLPASQVSYTDGLAIKNYINSTSTPTATILFRGTVIGNPLAPVVTFFSSRGPSSASPGILKPDIIGPGLNILAAWPVSVDNHVPPFNMISGTSMSCPHLSGIAALLKNSHPDWSPAAIKSAIMTTAHTLNLGDKPILDQRLVPADVFTIGAGHVNPLRANNPGLVYDTQPNDYIPYLCGLGYTDKQVGLILHQQVNCSEVKKIAEAQLNYPSFSIVLGSTSQFYTRTLTNVGPTNITYSVEIDVPLAVGMRVSPSQITFTEVNQKVRYAVGFYPENKENRGNHTFAQGSITWVSGIYSVRAPISVIFN